MNRQPLLELLTAYNPTAPEEIASKLKIINFVQQHPDCFERSLAIGHITASSWLLSKHESQALLMHHAKLDKWLQLGGHCDGNSDVLAVAIREAQEESGIQAIQPLHESIFDLDIHTIPANSREQAHDHYDIRFLLKVTNDEQPRISHESKALRWVNKNRQELPTDEYSVMRMFDKWTNGYQI